MIYRNDMNNTADSAKPTRSMRSGTEGVISAIIAGVLMVSLGGGMFVTWQWWQHHHHFKLVGGDLAMLSTKQYVEVAEASHDDGFLAKLTPGAPLGEMVLKEVGPQDKKKPISSKNILALFTGEVTLQARYEYDADKQLISLQNINLDSLVRLPLLPGITNPTKIDIKLTKAAKEIFDFAKKEQSGNIELIIKQYLIDGSPEELSIRALAKEVVSHSQDPQ